jgi:hypothetical protein
MRIAFYAPMKPPTHPTPSGDRQIARLIIAALERAGHEVSLAADFRSYDGRGDAARQAALAAEGAAIAAALIARWRADPGRAPQAWMTYHLYHKAPDHLGPAVAAALDIPWLVVEASFAPKQAGGPWDAGHCAVADALAGAAAVIHLNPADRGCVSPLLPACAAEVVLGPFTAVPKARPDRSAARSALAARHGLPAHAPWLLAVAMMRPDVKRESYLVLADALGRLADRRWHLLAVGDGPARMEIERAFAGLAGRVTWLGEAAPEALPEIYAACDLLVWPGVDEALGLSVLEAQAAGLPAVAGDAGALPTVVADGETGLVAPEGDAAAFAAAVAALLDDPGRRAAMGDAARSRAAERHSLDAAAARLDEMVRNAVESRRP